MVSVGHFSEVKVILLHNGSVGRAVWKVEMKTRVTSSYSVAQPGPGEQFFEACKAVLVNDWTGPRPGRHLPVLPLSYSYLHFAVWQNLVFPQDLSTKVVIFSISVKIFISCGHAR